MGSEGKGLGRWNEQVVFVEKTVPGDVVNAITKRKRKGFIEAFPRKFTKYSEIRRKPFCNHFGVCGGCKWQMISYEKQLEFKEEQVVSAVRRIGGFDGFETMPIAGSASEKEYRNKLEFTFSNKRWLDEAEIKTGKEIDRSHALGFHVPGRFDKIVDIDTCHLMNDLANKVRNKAREIAKLMNLTFYDLMEHKGLLRNLILRNTLKGQWMVIVAFAENNKKSIERFMDDLSNGFPEVTSWYYVINRKKNDTLFDQEMILFKGKDRIEEDFDGVIYRIGPKSFFQTNSLQALELYRKLVQLAELKKDDIVMDLYSGIGSIGLYVSRFVSSVLGVEFVDAAVEDARLNAKINGIENSRFIAGDMKDVLPDLIDKEKVDVVITDPPRAGMHKDVVRSILKLQPRRIIYVSCNPATQARDMKLMSDDYELKVIQPVDMFPQTTHVENIAVLDRVG